MPHTITIRVHDSNGRPLRGVPVRITITGTTDGGTCDGLTNVSGDATITTKGDYESSREILISVRGKFRERSTIRNAFHRLTVDH